MYEAWLYFFEVTHTARMVDIQEKIIWTLAGIYVTNSDPRRSATPG